ncbi:U3 small nucleolar RNA-associated protein 25 homolog isoform X2 [Montipora capricornis]|uniref:U3 small nucleolar RNA-associated protein 25 homolog isoform X2 n=1 Tax=Montipora capricornis TaxID=246305 RepID=UPI0035F17C85
MYVEMAKGFKHGGRKHRMKRTFQKASKGKKRSLKEYGGQHPVDDDFVDKKIKKRPRQESFVEEKEKKSHEVIKDHEVDSSEDEEHPDPYAELLGMFGIDPESDAPHVISKWKVNGSKEDDDDEGTEEEADDQIKKEKRIKRGKQAKHGSTQTKNKEKSNDVDRGSVPILQGNGNDGVDNGSERRDEDEKEEDDDDDDDDDILNTDEEDTEDYRKEEEAVEESDEEKVNDIDDIQGGSSSDNGDPFVAHFEQELDEATVKLLGDVKTWRKKTSQIPLFGSVTEISLSLESIPTVHLTTNEKTTFSDLKIRARLAQGWEAINGVPDSQGGLFTTLQQNLFYYINSYQDLFYSSRTFQNCDEIRNVYCLHAVNHILKTRSRVTKNTARIVQSWKDKKEIGELRDQGLTRPKVVILVPFRNAALKVIEVIMQLVCSGEGGQVMNKKRFYDEFGDQDEEKNNSKGSKLNDFKLMFTGNIDDCFRVGISVSRKALTLYAKFYSSDLIVASPLGLRTIIGNQGEKSHEYDFLSSIEIIIMDQADVFLMQNWEHVQHIFEHLHQQPKDSHGVDFSRVRMWCLEGWSKYYRQSLIFSSFVSPEMNSLFHKHCCNFTGKMKVSPSSVPGSICQVVVQVPQAYHRFESSSFAEEADKRFNFFITKVLPEFKDSPLGYTAIFVPSYFDFVRLRNYFKREAIDCAQISEYSQHKEIQRARTFFKQGRRRFLLFTERFYFFYRYRIKGMKNIIFYELPHYSKFYSDILNCVGTRKRTSDNRLNPVTCTVLYTKLNALRLAGVVGTQRCSHMISSKKDVHMFVTGDDKA